MNEALMPAGLANLAYAVAGPWLAVERSGRLLHANPAAQRWLDAASVMHLAGGMLRARRQSEDRQLRDTLNRVAATATLCLRSREGVTQLVLDFHSLSEGTVAVRIHDLTLRPEPAAGRLREVFGFTAAEARVAVALLAGDGIQAIAIRFGVEPETVRTQLKRMRGKTATRSQTQLVGLLSVVGE
jgi:DNA-binding CsgD family transcriptional regulator